MTAHAIRSRAAMTRPHVFGGRAPRSPRSSLWSAALLLGCAFAPAAAQQISAKYDWTMPSQYREVQDTGITFATRAGLKHFINAAYDDSIRGLRYQTDADRNTLIWYFGQKLPKWLVWDELNQHTLWTAGQIVANFRKHGMTLPPFSYY